MASKTHVPLRDEVVDDKQGNYHKIVKFRIIGSGEDKVDVGEVPSAASILSGPPGFVSTNFYLRVPSSSSGVDSLGRPDADTRRVSVGHNINHPNGEYELLVTFRGKNPAGL